ncbi:hypothetical protein EDWATA_02357 [Edwardsiella tarda ATCC 23685]|uniref:Uncharacterized protein n=1 Tax=Edwardsiella tarda ATCC 23685 TaxID=500638 RepID=D4F6H7_EDWTA|nr:hypothetical protein EDWATA_02357 [Edwardsiella tarda ATCC 23685]
MQPTPGARAATPASAQRPGDTLSCVLFSCDYSLQQLLAHRLLAAILPYTAHQTVCLVGILPPLTRPTHRINRVRWFCA